MTSCPQTVRNGPLSMPRMWVAGLVAPESLAEEWSQLQHSRAVAGSSVWFLLGCCCCCCYVHILAFFYFIVLRIDDAVILVNCVYAQHLCREIQLEACVCFHELVTVYCRISNMRHKDNISAHQISAYKCRRELNMLIKGQIIRQWPMGSETALRSIHRPLLPSSGT